MIYIKNFIRMFIIAGIILYSHLVFIEAHALTFTLPKEGESDTIGEIQTYSVKKKESWLSVANKFDVGIGELKAANPIAKKQGFRAGTKLTIPTKFTLPAKPWEGIVLDLSKLRIFYFHPDGETVSTYPVAIGQKGWSTPTGETTVIQKEKNPSWRPTASIRREAMRRGRQLALVVPPGPRNPLGQYAIRLGISGILIHGTNQPGSIGQRASHGCVRMFSNDIKDLFNLVPIGTAVKIIN